MFQNVQQVQAFIRERGIQFVDFKMIDLRGRWKHLSIPAVRFTQDILENGIGFDGSNYGYALVEKSDMVFIPDITTAVVDPFAKAPTLTMIGDVQVIDQPSNYPFAQYPRNVAKRSVAYMRELGVADEMIIGPEYEFHVFDGMRCSMKPNQLGYQLYSKESAWSSDCPVEQNSGFHTQPHDGYHADLPNDLTFDLRNEICLELAKWGVDVKYHHHEVGGSGQLEIEVELGEMTRLADATMIAKYVIRNTAAAHGMTATLMPKPILGEAGNGMHVHMLLKKDGKPVFYDPEGYAQLSRTAMYFIGGLLTHARSLCAITNPSTNSYKRLIPGFEAPVTVGYAMANRSAVIRIPAYVKTPDKKRFELRNPDATCNPYYAYAAILMAGLDGVKNKINPADHNWGPFDFNLFDLPEEERAKLGHLPASLDEALDALEADHDYLTAGGVFPESLIQTWLRTIRADSREISRIPHPAEFVKYYNL
ncbi:MAG: type I glutamate--ammonia ligase [Candidatus Faecousia sp.]|nr:type I glutamate--ammonia ligase [Bacillota bacterium]MDY4219536.1 type I glutamate--ammonia ligase [Candidatus Faecousia sp.]